MKKKKIEKHLASALNKAPIDLLEKVKNEPVRKMDEHDFITRQEPVKSTKRYTKVLVPVVSFIALFAVGYSVWYSQFQAIENKIFLDVNPSIEISTNKQDEVVELSGLNEDGKELIAGIDYEDKPIHQVTLLILDALLEQKYIDTESHTLLVSVLNEDAAVGTEKSHQLNEWIQTYLKERNVQPTVLQQSIQTSNTINEFAEQYDISIGKMTFIKNLMILNPEFNIEELVQLSLENLIVLSQQNGLDLSKIIEIEGSIEEDDGVDDIEEDIEEDNDADDIDDDEENKDNDLDDEDDVENDTDDTENDEEIDDNDENEDDDLDDEDNVENDIDDDETDDEEND